MRYAMYIPPNTKDLAINLTMVAYKKWQNVITFARVNNSDLLRAPKHLMETRLKNDTGLLLLYLYPSANMNKGVCTVTDHVLM